MGRTSRIFHQGHPVREPHSGAGGGGFFQRRPDPAEQNPAMASLSLVHQHVGVAHRTLATDLNQVEEQNFRRLARRQFEVLLFGHGGAVPFPETLAVERHGALSDLQPREASGP
jgi:hypothetical protein